MKRPNYDTNAYCAMARSLKQEYPDMPGTEIALRLGISENSVSRYLREILPRRIARRWTPKEIALLEKMAESTPVPVIAQTLNRSEQSVCIKAHTLKLNLRTTLDNYSSGYLASNLGVSPCTTGRWIADGLLNARKYKKQWVIAAVDFAAFCQQHPERVKSCDQEVIDWLTQGV